MIVPSEIIQHDIVKVLVDEDGIEDEMLAVVAMNTGRTLGLHYLNPTESIYKSACVYKLDRDEIFPAPYESVTEHHLSGTKFEDLEMKRVEADMYVYYSEIDTDESDSEVHEMNLASDTDSEMADFIVPDNEVEGQDIVPSDYATIDKEWNEWKPSSLGARGFKNTIDSIESRIRRLSD
tara:strand:- start:9715 stop:10251 length:537 start_codon:yes stop_codon:yes gene_type:complete